ncbi:MAG TPA: hypothetical protein VF831_06900 [Anaerolineales bacterium]
MVLKEFDLVQPPAHLVRPGDGLYFLRNKDGCTVRVKATVVRVSCFISGLDEDLPRTLKEFQTRLQLTEIQYDYWSTKKQVLLVEFDGAQKIKEIHVPPSKVADRSDWISFEDIGMIME